MKVTAIIPTYNRQAVLERAVRSCLQALDSNDELLILDDGSTDGTGTLVGSLQDSRIHYIWQLNAGAGAARNRAAAEASGELLAYLDSDDTWHPDKISIQRAFMAAHPDVLFCFTDFERDFGTHRERHSIHSWHSDPRSWIEILGAPVTFSSEGNPDVPAYTGDLYSDQMWHNYILTSCVMIRREAGDAIHFTENATTYEDWECFGRLARRGKAAYLDIETAVQHAHKGPRLTDADLLSCAEARLVVLQNVWGSDPEFLKGHDSQYHALVRKQELLRVKGLLVHGRAEEAAVYIRRLGADVPASYRLLAALPGRLVSWVLALRRRAMQGLREVSA